MGKPIVNQELCIGCGTCEGLCPAVFKVEEVNEKMAAVVKSADYDAEKANIDGAINSCPVQAISWNE